jgi:nucleoside-diphosphate-sugar epimerase
MRVLVTGHNGYIGSILTGLLTEAGHSVVGLDNYMFQECTFGVDAPEDFPVIRKDIRDVSRADLEGIDAVCHLAGISNDPVGDLDAEITYDINHRASVEIAALARDAGVERFVFSSSCSIYGSSPGGWVDEESEINPVTPYGWSKIYVEREVSPMATDSFSPVFLRNATAYGVSPRLRADLVINNLVGYAVTEKRVFMKSDGSPWRPLAHIEDISRAFLAVLEAPREAIHNEVFNVGATSENYQIRDVASLVESAVPESRFQMADSAGPDIRNYRVNCDKLVEAVPGFSTKWTVEKGIHELYQAFVAAGLTQELFQNDLIRIKHILAAQSAGLLSEDLRVIS